MPEITRIKAERNQRKTRVAAYARVSTLNEDQDESFEAQEKYYENKIKSNPDWEFVGVYGERKSGTHIENRDAFNKMFEDAMAGKIDLILCKSVSRWGRNTLEGLKAIKLLTGKRVNVVFEQEGIDTRMPGITLQMNIAASIAQSESESISENLKWIYRKRAEQGIYKAQKGRYLGYNTDDGNFTPNKDAPIVRGIFERYRAGWGFSMIANWLNDQGIRTIRGGEFTGTAVKSILSNEKYVGDVQFGKNPSRNVITGELDKNQIKKTVRDHHKGIVDRETWDAVQKRLEKSSASRGSLG